MPEDGLSVGSGCFDFRDDAAGPQKSLRVFYHRPRNYGPSRPIVTVLHGFDRAAPYFRDCWAGHSETLGALIVAPEFDAASFADVASYNYGNVRASAAMQRAFNPRSAWTFAILDRLFRHVKAITRSERDSFSLFGHSAGAQFAHRYLALAPEPLAEVVIAGNAGWYMLPEAGLEYPAGVGGLDFDERDLQRYLARRLIILLGDADVGETEEGLPREAAAVAQGPHRLARGKFYFEACRAIAAKRGARFGWELSIAPGVGHDDREIAVPAAALLGRSHPRCAPK